MKRVGVDIGGTFTDILILDEETARFDVLKVPSTPENVAEAPIEGLKEAIELFAVDPGEVRFVSHGCTVGTNTVIERKGAKTGLITTKGFRDVLELGRVAKAADLLYDIHQTKPDVLVPRNLRCEVAERVNYRGESLKEVSEEEVSRIVDEFVGAGVEAVAVCLLFSYIYPAHERAVLRAINSRCPQLYVTLSSSLSPIYGEYERTSTAVVNAYIGPVFTKYLRMLDAHVAETVQTPLYIMQSNGGLLGSRDAAEQPVRVLESGPTAGVIAAAHISNLIGVPNAISFDMGGTTAKGGLIIGGQSIESVEYEVGGSAAAAGGGHVHSRGTGFPICLPAVDVTEVGSGGGSIGWIDSGGAFRVGPRSMGARPGPACYGFGGEEPTVTDAQVTLGVINPANFLGGRMKLLPELSARAIENRICKSLGISVRDGARGIVKIANAKMAQAIRLVSINRGHDPRDFVMVALGGAGPMHACDIAREMEIPWVVVPRCPGLLSALGLVVSDIVHDYVQAYPRGDIDAEAISKAYEALEARGLEALDDDRVPAGARILLRTANLRYRGQNYTVNVPVSGGQITPEAIQGIIEAFQSKHEALYTFRLKGEQVELVSLRLKAVGAIPRPEFKSDRRGGASSQEALVGRRPVFYEVANDFVASPVLDRSRLLPGNVVAGPAIVEQLDSTVAIPPGMIGKVDEYENIIIGKEEWNGR